MMLLARKMFLAWRRMLRLHGSAGEIKQKRDFSLRKPIDLRERDGKRKSACSVRNGSVGGRRDEGSKRERSQSLRSLNLPPCVPQAARGNLLFKSDALDRYRRLQTDTTKSTALHRQTTARIRKNCKVSRYH